MVSICDLFAAVPAEALRLLPAVLGAFSALFFTFSAAMLFSIIRRRKINNALSFSLLSIIASFFLFSLLCILSIILDSDNSYDSLFCRLPYLALIGVLNGGLISLLISRDTLISRRTAFSVAGASIPVIALLLLPAVNPDWIVTIAVFLFGSLLLGYGIHLLLHKERGQMLLILSAFYLLQLPLIWMQPALPLFVVSALLVLCSIFPVAADVLMHVPEVDKDYLLSDKVDTEALTLTRFIPKEFLNILEKNSAGELCLGDHVKRDMTIFFSDIRQFTTLSEDLTPEENFKFINSYLSRIVPVITNNGGFVDKYMGDAIMALFPNCRGADEAVQTAIDMQQKIVEYNGHRSKCGYRPLSMGIGLHTGTLMMGVVGVEDRMQNTVVSDAVNLASRLESITKVFNINLAISEETFKNLEDPGAYMYRFIGKVRVKGKAAPVSVFEIYDGMHEKLLEQKMKANKFFEQGMLDYYHKDFVGAMFNFRKVLDILPDDGASAFYLDNCMSKVRA